jgi:chromosome segregation ATPase
MEDEKQILTDTNAQVEKLEKKFQDFEPDAADRKQFREMETKLNEMRELRAYLETELFTCQHSRVYYEREYKSTKRELDQAIRHNVELSEQRAKLEQEVKELNTEKGVLKAEITSLKEEVTDRETRFKNLTEAVQEVAQYAVTQSAENTEANAQVQGIERANKRRRIYEANNIEMSEDEVSSRLHCWY